MILGGKCPDFTNVNGRKAVVELYGDYWHRGQDEDPRIAHFAQFGFSAVVIWEHDLKHPDAVVEKIRTMVYSKGE